MDLSAEPSRVKHITYPLLPPSHKLTKSIYRHFEFGFCFSLTKFFSLFKMAEYWPREEPHPKIENKELPLLKRTNQERPYEQLQYYRSKVPHGKYRKWRVGVTFVKFQLDGQINFLNNKIFPNVNILHFYLSRTSNYKSNMTQVPSVMPEIKSPPAREITPLHQLMYHSCIYLA